MHAINVSKTGGPEVLAYTELPDPVPGPGEAVVALEACGVNFIDVYQRTGLYPVPLPFVIGQEGAGVVVAIGPDAGPVEVGDRVAFTGVLGGYAERALVPADRLVRVPEAIETDIAAAVLLQGLTAHYLVHDTYRLGPDSRCLIHAGAGGVGRLLIQMAKQQGATVFATAGTDEKAELAKAAGADHVTVYTRSDFQAEIEAVVGERGLDVVYDSVGVATFERGLALLRPRGMVVLFGQSSGPVPPFDLGALARAGSLYVTRPRLGDYIQGRTALAARTDALFNAVVDGDLTVRIGGTVPLAEAAAAHRALESRATTGKLLLIP
ncbi:MAG: quinone oxidoreductase [Acidimicrobiia bacterium]|nr:quinone oxidoreductase [Acidimicrobiia bacterium]MBT8194561.1 quinone oxidoreductase [Acidimicrobiia bacterium]MBT8247428.1 quinone oxidoreductase [Acidimicrobiia bacterium]NNF88970.1 quinone oxidoreductase [Acidimicrobiia bacterium]NNJ48628.1 quinone oxidoreductase [Acidimicrobiia bacterium]